VSAIRRRLERLERLRGHSGGHGSCDRCGEPHHTMDRTARTDQDFDLIVEAARSLARTGSTGIAPASMSEERLCWCSDCGRGRCGDSPRGRDRVFWLEMAEQVRVASAAGA
jgi:hypothetical protein